jgi:hypothetical protein
VDNKQWEVGSKQWGVDMGQWVMDKKTVDSKLWVVVNRGHGTVGSGQWAVNSGGQWAAMVGSKQWAVNSG